MKQKLKNLIIAGAGYELMLIKWLVIGLLTGALCGVLGAAFAHSVTFVTGLRAKNGWLLFLLPVGGIATVALYKALRVSGVGTNRVLEGARGENKVPFLLAPAVFVCSVITHLCGGSAGREGAALQLGGSVTALLSRILKLDSSSQKILTICGMGAFFAAIFGTPLGASVFALEVAIVGGICTAAIFPVTVSAVTANAVADILRVNPERFSLTSVPDLSPDTAWRVLVLAVTAALVSVLFYRTMRFTEKWFERLFKNEFLRAAVGGSIIILLTVIIGTTDYNGGGIDVIARVFESGEVRYEAFLLKIIFTAVTIAAGFKGGEIIPTLFIGATFGAAFASLLGLAPAFGAAIGMSALFCGVTNCPLATVLLCTEMFGAEGIVYFAISAATSLLLSGKGGLYSSQKHIELCELN